MYFESRFVLRRGSGVVREEGERRLEGVVSTENQRSDGGCYPLRHRSLAPVSGSKQTSAVGHKPLLGTERSRGLGRSL